IEATVTSPARAPSWLRMISAIMSSMTAALTMSCPTGVFTSLACLRMFMAIPRDVGPKHAPAAIADWMLVGSSAIAITKAIAMGRTDPTIAISIPLEPMSLSVQPRRDLPSDIDARQEHDRGVQVLVRDVDATAPFPVAVAPAEEALGRVPHEGLDVRSHACAVLMSRDRWVLEWCARGCRIATTSGTLDTSEVGLRAQGIAVLPRLFSSIRLLVSVISAAIKLLSLVRPPSVLRAFRSFVKNLCFIPQPGGKAAGAAPPAAAGGTAGGNLWSRVD
ncbi:hypothetical protein THAOC_15476, partial [Thalassiosira oceanica]